MVKRWNGIKDSPAILALRYDCYSLGIEALSTGRTIFFYDKFVDMPYEGLLIGLTVAIRK